MTIEFLPFDVTPSSPITYYQLNFEAIERIFPLDADWILRVWAASIDWSDGTIVPIENLPIDEIRELLTDESTFLTDVSLLSGLTVQYKDDTSVFVIPGQVAHRGKYKRQPLVSSIMRVVLISTNLVVAGDGDTGTTSDLKADSWYYGYAKLDVASAFPDFKFSVDAPTNDDGYGLEHPTETGYRYVGCFRTGPAPAASILAYHAYEHGRFFWREIIHGPELPENNLSSLTGGYIAVDVSEYVPPIADVAFFTSAVFASDSSFVRVRTTGDSADRAGYDNPGDSNAPTWCDWMEVPVNLGDATTGLGTAGTTVDLNSNSNSPGNQLAVVGFNAPRD